MSRALDLPLDRYGRIDPVLAWSELGEFQRAQIGQAAIALMACIAWRDHELGSEIPGAVMEGEPAAVAAIRRELLRHWPDLLNGMRLPLTEGVGVVGCRGCGGTQACDGITDWAERDLCAACARERGRR